MTETCKEDNNLNFQEMKCVAISQIIYVTNCKNLKFDYLHFTTSDCDSMVVDSRTVRRRRICGSQCQSC